MDDKCGVCGAEIGLAEIRCSFCLTPVRRVAVTNQPMPEITSLLTGTLQPTSSSLALTEAASMHAAALHEEPFTTSAHFGQSVIAYPDNRARVAMTIEIIAGIFGFLGVGHFYSGRKGIGAILLLCWLPFYALMVGSSTFGGILSGGSLCLCTVPLLLGIPVFSGIQVERYLRGHPR